MRKIRVVFAFCFIRKSCTEPKGLSSSKNSHFLCVVEKLFSSPLIQEFSVNTLTPSVVSSDVIQYTRKVLHLNTMDISPFEKEDNPKRAGVSASFLGVGIIMGSRIVTN